MYPIFSSRVFRVATTSRRPLLQVLNLQTIRHMVNDFRRVTAMATEFFKGTTDHYNGITIDSNDEPCEIERFSQRLEASLQHWTEQKKRAIWFRVNLAHADWVPILTKYGFKYHHAREQFVMLYHWLPVDQVSNIPSYAHTNLGVGGFVYNDKTDEVLVLKEKYTQGVRMWKIPGGYVNPGENLDEAVQREVLEETGIQTEFKCLVGFRHVHKHSFGCSDMYIVAYLSPINLNIKICTREICECRWMKLDEYIGHPEVYQPNRLLANKMKEFLQQDIGLTLSHAQHPITKQRVSMYLVSSMKAEVSHKL